MNNNIINISFINENLFNSLNASPKKVTELIKSNPYNSIWLNELSNEMLFEPRKQKIIDFDLNLSSDGKYKKVEVENAITLYEHLKDLPRYVLVDKRFWLWLEFDKFYRIAVQSMPLNTDTRLEYGWLFKEGKRGLWRNTFSRSFFWVEFTIDETRSDKYELTKFVFEKPERIRNLTFDNKYRNVVLSTIRAEKDIYDKYVSDENYKETIERCERGLGTKNIYTFIRKSLSLYGSARIIDFMDEEDLYDVIYEKLDKAIQEVHNGNMNYILQ